MQKQIFLGAGTVSMAGQYELHQELERAFMLLGGVQQPPDPCEKPDKEDDDRRFEDSFEVERIAKYIAERLTGKKVTFSKGK